MTSNLKASVPLTLSGGMVCAFRIEILDRLAKAVERLGRAKLNLRDCLDEGAFMPGEFVTGEVEQLRLECGLIRSELEQHRAAHGC